MGESLSKPKNYQQQRALLDLQILPKYLASLRKLPPDLLNQFSIIPSDDPDRILFSDIFEQMKKGTSLSKEFIVFEDEAVERCVASLLGLAVCDALGASTEFIPYTQSGLAIIKNGFTDIVRAIDNGLLEKRHGMVGVWTDDCSMALCMADSMIHNSYRFDPKHIRYMFLLWLWSGLNNGGRKHSIGLGGNIKISMDQFMHKQQNFCKEGEQFNNGQPPSLFAVDSMKYWPCDWQVSLVGPLTMELKLRSAVSYSERTCGDFKANCESVQYLAKSMQEPQHYFQTQCLLYGSKFKKFNRSTIDRNWNWKDANFTYSPTRAKDKPDYVGSYCMDALAMALHTVWHTSSFMEVALLNANMGGDCDTVGAIAGQIAGAMYGVEQGLLNLYSQMEDFTKGRYEVFLKAAKLAGRKT